MSLSPIHFSLNCLLFRSLLPNLVKTSLETLLILNGLECLVVLDPLLLPYDRPLRIRHIRNTLLHLCHTRDNSSRIERLGVQLNSL
ncbi:hypothetical protein COCOBI_pt-1430 (chloroplast) [Coccomyxa sp. Obi]|nr:hypothetical protein COCOBI_pt-1430 [Coccomyxa sp. Obi]